nr:hypothetical protein [Vibrio cholerae]
MENLVKMQMLWRSQLMNYAEDGPQMKIKSLCSRLKKIQQLDEEEQKAISMVLESMLIRHSTKSILNHGA